MLPATGSTMTAAMRVAALTEEIAHRRQIVEGDREGQLGQRPPARPRCRGSPNVAPPEPAFTSRLSA